jgi:hypothetical protein
LKEENTRLAQDLQKTYLDNTSLTWDKKELEQEKKELTDKNTKLEDDMKTIKSWVNKVKFWFNYDITPPAKTILGLK